MKTEPSQGPYRYSGPHNFSDTWICYLWDGNKEQNEQIARVHGDSKDATEANAKLLAASWEMRELLRRADDNIREHLQVAKYNLRGEQLGEFVGKPEVPMLIHERGIAGSEKVRLEIRNLLQSLCPVPGYSDTPEAPKTPTIESSCVLEPSEKSEALWWLKKIVGGYSSRHENPDYNLLISEATEFIHSLTNKEPLAS